MTTIERTNELTLKGNPLTVIGPRLQPGDKFPAVKLTAPDWSAVDLASFSNHIRLISVVPSLDTGICDAQTKRFNEEAEKLGDRVKVITVSADLPWAQRRWMNDAEVKNITVLSDHAEMAFGDAVGTHVKEMRIEQRAVFVVDKDDTIVYAEYVPEIAQHPNYDAALEAVHKLLSQS
ncbi:MAG: thiol peroxidase [Anaerolineae bacterium]|nr:thiol peroxidase [Thermoflexales bacterium]MDW8396202.1 thiol peroxidase [Anaerolineae bacterium]